jgi:drug/metabolite transporter (DMT)-like permease
MMATMTSDQVTATLLALTAACMHAGWNLAVKRSAVDRFHALWGQVVFGASIAIVVFVALGGMDSSAWKWAMISGVVHIPYTVLLTKAYDTGDFSQVYPLARGGGALAAAAGGVAFLDDRLSGWTALAILVVVGGLFLLVGRAPGPAALAAVGVALSIGTYTLVDSQGSRASGVAYYGLATGTMAAIAISAYGFAAGRHRGFAGAIRQEWRTMLVGGIAQKLTYTFVLAAVRLAPVGYVTALRESSVVLAVLIGWRVLGEPQGRRRGGASVIVLAGVVLLVTTAA